MSPYIGFDQFMNFPSNEFEVVLSDNMDICVCRHICVCENVNGIWRINWISLDSLCQSHRISDNHLSLNCVKEIMDTYIQY